MNGEQVFKSGRGVIHGIDWMGGITIGIGNKAAKVYGLMYMALSIGGSLENGDLRAATEFTVLIMAHSGTHLPPIVHSP